MSVNWNMGSSQQRSCGDTAAVGVTPYSGILWPCTRSLTKGTAGPRIAALDVFLTVGLLSLLNGGVFPLSPTKASDVSAVPDLPHPIEYTLGKSGIAERDTEKREDLYTSGEASGELAESQEEQVYKEDLSGLSTGASGDYPASAREKQFPNDAYLATEDDPQRAPQETAIAAEAAGTFDSGSVIMPSVASLVSKSLQAAQSSLHGDAGQTNEDEVAAPGGAVENVTEWLNQAGAPQLLNLVKEANGDTGVEETGPQWWDQDIRIMPNAEGNQVETADFGAMLRELLDAPSVDKSETAGEPEAQGDAVAIAQHEGTEEPAPEDDNQSRALTAAGSAGTPPGESKTDKMVSADGGAAEETTTALTGAEGATAHSYQLPPGSPDIELAPEDLLPQHFLHGNESEQHVTATDSDTPTAEGETGTLVGTDEGAAGDSMTAFTGAESTTAFTHQLPPEGPDVELAPEGLLPQHFLHGNESEQDVTAKDLDTPTAEGETGTLVGTNGGAADDTATAFRGVESTTAVTHQLPPESPDVELSPEGLLPQHFLHGNESEQRVTATDSDTPTAEGEAGTIVSTDGGAAGDTATAFTGPERESTHTTQLLSESSHLGTPSEDSQSQQLPDGDENDQYSVATENVPSGMKVTDTFSGAAVQNRDVQPSVRAELSLEAPGAAHSHTEDGIDPAATEESREEKSTSKSWRTMKLLRGAAVTESSVARGTNPVSQPGEKVVQDNSLTRGESKEAVDCQSTSALSSKRQDLALEAEEQGDTKTTRKTTTQRGTRKGSTHRDHTAVKNGARWKKILAVGAAAGLAAAGATGLSMYSEANRGTAGSSGPQ